MMNKFRLFGSLILISTFLFSCSPKSETTETEPLSESSKLWIPFSGDERITFISVGQNQDTSVMTFTGQEKISWFENIRYMTDQSGFINFQTDYYADLERLELYFTCPATDYFLKYSIQQNKGETGDWDIFKVELADGDYYKNEMKIVIYQTDKYDKGDNFAFKSSVKLNGQVYTNVYYLTQDRRPFELYYTEQLGVIGFKLSSNEIWTIQTDSIP